MLNRHGLRSFPRLGRALSVLAALVGGLSPGRADVAVPFPDYSARRKATDIVHEPSWAEVKTRPDAYRGLILGYFLKLDGRIDSPGEARLICHNRAGEALTVVCPGGCRVGEPGEWIGVLGGIPAAGQPAAFVASMVSRIAPPGQSATSSGSATSGGSATAGGDGSATQPDSAPTTDQAGSQPGQSAPTAGAGAQPPGWVEVAGAPPTPPQQAAAQAGPGAFAPPYEMVHPAHLAILERFIVSCNKRLPADMRKFIGAEIIRVAAQFGVRWEFYAGIVAAESDFDPRCTSNKGAAGLAQLMPETGLEVGVPVDKRYDIRLNLTGALAYIRKQLNKYLDRDPSTQLILTLASYNAGPGAVRKYGGVPPYNETHRYIERVTRHYLQLCAETAKVR